MNPSQIGFIGTGTIGAPIAKRLLQTYADIVAYDTNPAALENLANEGASCANSVAEITKTCDLVFASLPGPPQIASVMLAEDGLLANTGQVKIIVDLSTNALKLNREIAQHAAERGIDYLDAPVSGGARAAMKGALSVMVGGNKLAFEQVEPVLASFASHITHMGDSGSGTLCKLVNNQIFLCASVLVQEGFVMGAKAGMDPNALLEVLNASSAAPIVKRAPLVLSRDFDMGIFSLDIAAKDVAVMLESARDLKVSMPMTEAASSIYQQAIETGLGSKDFFATVKILEQMADHEIPVLSTD